MGDNENLTTNYQSGITWRSILALIFSAVFLTPVIIFSNLIGAGGGIDIAIYATLIFFTELFLFFHKPLTQHEITLIYCTAWLPIGTMSGSMMFLNYLYNGYFARSPVTAMFKDPYTGFSLRDVIPWWFAPSHNSEVYLLRTFIHPDWFAPIIISIISLILSLLMIVALAMIIINLYIEIEKLPFPLANVDASICRTLGDREPVRMRSLMIGALIGLIYGAVLFMIPIISSGVFGIQASLLPIPWIDLNFHIEKVFPGASFGIATDLIPYVWGFVFPPEILISIFLGSFSVWFFGNYAALKIPYFTDWQREWTPGMSISLIFQRATLWIWASPQIGFALAVAVFNITKYRKSLFKAFKSMIHFTSSSKAAGYFPLKIALLIYFIGSLGSIALFLYLIPDFPLWALFLMFTAYPFFTAIVAGRIVGETSFQISIPYVWQGTLLASGFPKTEAWFAPAPVTAGEQAAGQMYIVKIMTLTNTKPGDFFKFLILMFPLSIFASFTYTSLFWMIAPIPSVFYPATVINWPVSAAIQGLWCSRQLNIFKPDLIIGGFAAVLFLAFITSFMRSIPFSIAAFVGGTFMQVPSPLAMLLGYLVGKYVISRYIDNWENIKTSLVGGIILGEGISIVLASSIVVVAKSLWTLPY
jgi:hypothetical protein